MPTQPFSTIYPITLGAYCQTIGEVTEKVIGPAVLMFPLLINTMSLNIEKAIPTSLLVSLFLFGTPTAVTQFTLIYAKSKHEDNAENKNDTWVIRLLTKHPVFVFFMTNLAALAEGLTASAAIIRFGLKTELTSFGRDLGNGIDDFLISVFAVIVCFSRYKKINYVDSQEARNEYEKRRMEKLSNPIDRILQKKLPFKKRIQMIDPTLTNYLSYQISPNLENLLNILGPYMLYSDVSEIMPNSVNTGLFALCLLTMVLSCYGEYCAQLQDSKWYRDNAYLSYKKAKVDSWKHGPYGLGKLLLGVAKLPGQVALLFSNTDPTAWIYRSIKVSKIAGFTCLMGAAPFELYKVVEGETAHPSLAVGIPIALIGMAIGLFAARGQCRARDTGLRNIAAYLAYQLGVRSSDLDIPKPENYFKWPGIWYYPPTKEYYRELTSKARMASDCYLLSA